MAIIRVEVATLSVEAIGQMVTALAMVNLAWYREQPNPKPTLDRVRYVTTPNDTWLDFPSLLKAGAGDCEDLVAARLAELWFTGVRAEALVEWQVPTKDYHVVIVHLPGGWIEDPSKSRLNNVY